MLGDDPPQHQRSRNLTAVSRIDNIVYRLWPHDLRLACAEQRRPKRRRRRRRWGRRGEPRRNFLDIAFLKANSPFSATFLSPYFHRIPSRPAKETEISEVIQNYYLSFSKAKSKINLRGWNLQQSEEKKYFLLQKQDYFMFKNLYSFNFSQKVM